MRDRTPLLTYLVCGLLSLTGFVSALLIKSAPSNADYHPPPNARIPDGGSTTTGVRGGQGASGVYPESQAYQPPPEARSPNVPTGSSGTRHCSASQNNLRLTPLAPQQHVGQTLSSHPTFVWFVPVNSSLNGEFQIYKLTEEGNYQRLLTEPHRFESASGFMTFTLPEDTETLQPETDYIWQVLLRCSDRPSDIYMARAQVEFVDASERFSALATAPIERAIQFAAAGLWYDALALVSQLPVDPNAATLRSQLLEDLANIEAETEASSEVQSSEMPYSQALRQIAN